MDNIELGEYISKLSPSELLYPLDLSEKFDIDISVVHQYLEKLTRENVLTSVLKIFCPKCNHRDNEIYNAYWSLPKHYTCPLCGEKLDPLVDSFLVYIKL